MAVKKYTSDELSDWLEKKALLTEASMARRVLTLSDERSRSTALIGRLYFFKYDPKTKADLPYWDVFPIVIVLERYNDGFLGLNMHYLSKGQRKSAVALMNEFYDKKKPFTGTTTGRGLTNWELLINSSTGVESMANKSVHRYLYKQCRSQFIRINKDEYDKAIQLPIDEWVYKR